MSKAFVRNAPDLHICKPHFQAERALLLDTCAKLEIDAFNEVFLGIEDESLLLHRKLDYVFKVLFLKGNLPTNYIFNLTKYMKTYSLYETHPDLMGFILDKINTDKTLDISFFFQ